MGFMDKLKAGAEEVKVGAKETTARARDTVHEAQVRHDLAQAYTELGHTTYTLIDEGSLHVLSAAEFGCWRTPKPRPSEAERVARQGVSGSNSPRRSRTGRTPQRMPQSGRPNRRRCCGASAMRSTDLQRARRT